MEESCKVDASSVPALQCSTLVLTRSFDEHTFGGSESLEEAVKVAELILTVDALELHARYVLTCMLAIYASCIMTAKKATR